MSFKKRHIYRSARPVAGNTKVMWFSITAGLVFLIVMLMVLRSLGHGDEEAPGTGSIRLSDTPRERTKRLAQEIEALEEQRAQPQAHATGGSDDHGAAQDKFASTRKTKPPRAGTITSTAPQEAAEKGAGVDGAAAQGAAAGGRSSGSGQGRGKPGELTGAGGAVGTGSTGRLAVVDTDHAEGGDANERKCHTEEHAEFGAPTVVVWGSNNIKASADECCASCKANAECNVWVYCADKQGCPGNHGQGECWLKHTDKLHVTQPDGARSPDLPWTSGAVYSRQEALTVAAAEEAANAAERERRAALRADASRPLVWLDVAIRGEPIGRMEFVLFTKEAPRAAENFRALCTCEKGHAPEGHEGAGKAYCLKGAYFYRIIDRFIDQTGAGTDSVYGGFFKDDAGGLALKHDRAGLLSMANRGPDTNGSHFSILVAPAPHLNGKYTIFGELVSGWHVAEAINALARGKPDNTAGESEGAQITDSGQLYRT